MSHNHPVMDDRMLPPFIHELPHTAIYLPGCIHDWTGETCKACGGSGRDEYNGYGLACRQCAGTGERYGAVWKIEE